MSIDYFPSLTLTRWVPQILYFFVHDYSICSLLCWYWRLCVPRYSETLWLFALQANCAIHKYKYKYHEYNQATHKYNRQCKETCTVFWQRYCGTDIEGKVQSVQWGRLDDLDYPLEDWFCRKSACLQWSRLEDLDYPLEDWFSRKSAKSAIGRKIKTISCRTGSVIWWQRGRSCSWIHVCGCNDITCQEHTKKGQHSVFIVFILITHNHKSRVTFACLHHIQITAVNIFKNCKGLSFQMNLLSKKKRQAWSFELYRS